MSSRRRRRRRMRMVSPRSSAGSLTNMTARSRWVGRPSNTILFRDWEWMRVVGCEHELGPKQAWWMAGVIAWVIRGGRADSRRRPDGSGGRCRLSWSRTPLRRGSTGPSERDCDTRRMVDMVMADMVKVRAGQGQGFGTGQEYDDHRREHPLQGVRYQPRTCDASHPHRHLYPCFVSLC